MNVGPIKGPIKSVTPKPVLKTGDTVAKTGGNIKFRPGDKFHSAKIGGSPSFYAALSKRFQETPGA